MSASVTDAGDGGLPLTGERTIPGLAEENYWFRRHEIAYLAIAERYAGKSVLEAGSGEGYGAAMLADAGATVTALDYDESAVAHVRAAVIGAHGGGRHLGRGGVFHWHADRIGPPVPMSSGMPLA